MQACNNRVGFWMDMTRELLFSEKNGKSMTKTTFNFLFLSPFCCPARNEFIEKFVNAQKVEKCNEKYLLRCDNINLMRENFLKLMMENIKKARLAVEKKEKSLKESGYTYSAKEKTNDYREEICCFLDEKACQDTAKMKASDFYEYFMDCDSWEDEKVLRVIEFYNEVFSDVYGYFEKENLDKNVALLRSKALEKYNRLRNKCAKIPEPPSFLTDNNGEYGKLILFSLLYDASEKDQFSPLLKMFGVTVTKASGNAPVPLDMLYNVSINALKNENAWTVEGFLNFIAYVEGYTKIIESAPKEFITGVLDCCKFLYNRIGEGEIEGSADEILKIRNRFKNCLEKFN